MAYPPSLLSLVFLAVSAIFRADQGDSRAGDHRPVVVLLQVLGCVPVLLLLGGVSSLSVLLHGVLVSLLSLLSLLTVLSGVLSLLILGPLIL